MSWGMLIIYLLGACLVFVAGLFADDVLPGRGTTLAWRALGAVLWPVALPIIVVVAVVARLRRRRTEGGGHS